MKGGRDGNSEEGGIVVVTSEVGKVVGEHRKGVIKRKKNGHRQESSVYISPHPTGSPFVLFSRHAQTGGKFRDNRN